MFFIIRHDPSYQCLSWKKKNFKYRNQNEQDWFPSTSFFVYIEYEEIKHHRNLPCTLLSFRCPCFDNSYKTRLRKEIQKLLYWYICDLTQCNAVKNSKQVVALSLSKWSKLAPVTCRKPSDSLHKAWNRSCQFRIIKHCNERRFMRLALRSCTKQLLGFISDFFLIRF